MSYTVRHYCTAAGKDPYQEWLGRLKDTVAKAAITRRTIRIELGEFGDHKGVGAGVSELRVDVGPGYRVYFGIDGGKVVILLVGGAKRSQQRDIERAKEYWKDYRARHDEI